MAQCKWTPPENVDPAAVRAEMEKALDEAEAKAHRNLAIYKFSNFGYWAAMWVHINRLGQFHRPNPFFQYVWLARKIRKGVQHAHQMESDQGD